MDSVRHRIEILQLKIRYINNLISRLKYLHTVLTLQKKNYCIFLRYDQVFDLSAIDQQITALAERIHQQEGSLNNLEHELHILQLTSLSETGGDIR
jgi:hypothetical protein